MKMAIPRNLPLLIIADGVLLPGSSMRVPVNNPKNMVMVKTHILRYNTLSSTVIGVIPRRAGSEKDDLSEIHDIGTAAVVVQVTGTNWPKPAYTLLVTGLCRFKVDKLLQEDPYAMARITQLDKVPGDGEEDMSSVNVAETFRLHANQLLEMLDVSVPIVGKLKKVMEKLPLTRLPDIFASIVKASYDEKLQVLDAVDIEERFQKALPLLLRQLEGLRLLKEAKKGGDRSVLPPGLKEKDTIILKPPRFRSRDAERRDRDSDGDEISELEGKIKAAGMPEHAAKACEKELKRLKKMPAAMPEYAMTRNYLELMADLPWSKESDDTLDITKARVDLDADHYGLDKLKKRVIEYLAVRQIKNSLKGPILCFIGPPGVGKTSVGRSIAQTLGRKFYRISLGGCYDQSDIRGHRRTYIGSMPGRIINGLRTAGVNNPVFLLDEIDKLGKGLHGDPAAALLEVLDPEQNFTFTDHYLNVPFDLSQVLFIATANSAATIPTPLLDRMEIIHVPGYTQEEKAEIALRHLVSKQLKEHGLTEEQLQFTEDGIKLIIARYTRESGVRALERKLGSVCRAVAVKVAEHQSRQKSIASPSVEEEEKKEVAPRQRPTEDALIEMPPEMPIVIDKLAIRDILGPAIYEREKSERLSQPGVAIGLAWTTMGGEIMFVEAAKMGGDRELTLTGQLGDVMKESAQLALTWVRSHAAECGLDQKTQEDLLRKTDVHIHFPAGAVGKDGPSAGVTITCVLVSLFSDRCVRCDTAMTGEITLRGMVSAVGGIKEKVLAAHRAGIYRIILPKRNETDLEEVPKNVLSQMTFVFARTLEDVLDAAFEGGFPHLKRTVVSEDVIPSKL
ncbi:lon protease homolog 2, peroxisomal-like [Apostichopus japonicus]|uniref:lon protease homolog 2, peroxisomal-like n=1 Tax=Stichopus japonicus TaxID=307972 RepID=UPI003AB1789E